MCCVTILVLLVLGLSGVILLSFLPKLSTPVPIIVAAYLSTIPSAATAVIYHLIAANVKGMTKRSISICLISGLSESGGLVAPYLIPLSSPFFDSTRSTRFSADIGSLTHVAAKAVMISCLAFAAISSVGLFFYYRWANRWRCDGMTVGADEERDTKKEIAGPRGPQERDKKRKKEGMLEVGADIEAWRDGSDRADWSFRYVS